jgi:cob(I)alamin adenosyltransferase
MKRKARVILLTGKGKGKTTAALGMALRASGHGMRTLIIQFVKNDTTIGELKVIRRLPGVEIKQVGLGFVPKRADPRFAAHREAAQKGLREAAEAIASSRYQLIVLDEVCVAVAHGLLDEQRVCEVMREASPDCCIVLTGRNATEGLIALADTVTEMRCVKHAFEQGRPAQEGVEF